MKYVCVIETERETFPRFINSSDGLNTENTYVLPFLQGCSAELG